MQQNGNKDNEKLSNIRLLLLCFTCREFGFSFGGNLPTSIVPHHETVLSQQESTSSQRTLIWYFLFIDPST